MQRLIFIILSVFFLGISCKNNNEKGMLSLKDMTALMTQIHLVDGYLNTLPSDSAQRVIESLYAAEYSKYNLDSTAFKANVTYFFSNPDYTKTMYEQIQSDLSALDKEYMREDSIRYAHASDSVSRVSYYHKWASDMHRLLFDKQDSSINLNFGYYGRSFLRKVRFPEVLIVKANPEVDPATVAAVAKDSTKSPQPAPELAVPNQLADSVKVIEEPVAPANRDRPRLRKIN